jgi:hypothetical protein
MLKTFLGLLVMPNLVVRLFENEKLPKAAELSSSGEAAGGCPDEDGTGKSGCEVVFTFAFAVEERAAEAALVVGKARVRD